MRALLENFYLCVLFQKRLPVVDVLKLKSNSLAVKRPDLVKLLVNKEDAVLTCGSNRKVRWWCENGKQHWFEMTVAARSKGSGCGVCAGYQIWTGFNDLASQRPEIAQYFNIEETRKQEEKYPEKKWAVSSESVTVGSGKYAVWNCENGEQHWFEMVVSDRTKGRGCSVCAGKQVWTGFNDLASQRPDIAALWNEEKTREYAEKYPKKQGWGMSADRVTVGSNKYAVFQCDNGFDHHYSMIIREKTFGNGCPVCSGHRVFSGFNDLAFLRPDVAQYFNGEQTRLYSQKCSQKHDWALSAEEVTVNSGKYAVWDCENGEGHWFKMRIADRTGTQRCSYCSGRRILLGFNDLPTVCPDVASLWDYQGNAEKSRKDKKHPVVPEEVTGQSGRLCLWLCQVCSCSFEKRVADIVNNSRLCPSCTESQGEKELAECIADLLPGDIKILRNDRTVLRPRELDIYVPELRLAFEFNGDYHHSDASLLERCGETAIEYHTKKLDGCATQGIDLFFVWWSDWNDSRKRATIEKYVKEIVALKIGRREVKRRYALLKILTKSTKG